MALILTSEMTFLVELVIFWAILYVLAYAFHLEKHGLEVKPGYFMFKSKALNSFLDRLTNRSRILWAVLSKIGLALSIGLMAFSIYTLGRNLLSFFFPTTGQVASIVPAIPVLTIRLYWLPYFFLAAAIIVLTHELAHGVIARLENIPVLSTGVLAFLVFFGAFVEPDEKEFEKSPLLVKLRLLAAGSSTNLITGLLVLLLIMGLFAAPAGVLIQEVVPNSPVEKAGFKQWDVIKGINGQHIFTPNDFYNSLRNVTPGIELNLTVLHDNKLVSQQIITIERPTNKSEGIIGVLLGDSYRPSIFGLDQYINVHFFHSLSWIYLLGISVAIFNMLPAYPMDGERVLYYPLASLVKKRKKELRIAINIFAWGLFATNIVLSIWQLGLGAI
jgi:membrane-associated protease RseP (regulator of RpoE activity)